MRILLVEDNRSLVKSLKKGLTEESYAVDVAFDGDEGNFLASTNSYDVIILDWMLPKMDGLCILKNIRKQGIQTQVLMLTAKDDPREKVTGLDEGADDYLTKPFHYEELLARIRALIRRKHHLKSPVIEIADLKIHTGSHQVWRDNKEIILQPKEYALLEYLAYHPNEIVSRTQLWEHLYEWQHDSLSNIIDVYINHLRNKIDKDSSHKLLHTIRGEGYLLRG